MSDSSDHADDTFEPAAPAAPAAPDLPAPIRRVRRGIGLAAASALLVGSGILGGVALVGGGSSTTAASTPAQTTQGSTTQGSTTQGSTTQGTGGGTFQPGGQAIAPQYDPSTSGGSTSGASFTQETASDATAAQSRGLVEITSTLTNGTAAGTGLILTTDGTVVTNHHVVAGATSVKVTVVSTGKTYDATYVGGDATTDVAVLKLAGASGLTPITIASSAAAANDEVTAIGDAGGDGGSLTAAPGTVAATDQNITVQDDDGSSSNLTGLIEMAAYVVPGDSGGVVRNSDGEAVGMNVAASTGRGTVVGYAIPIATVTKVVDEILSGQASSTVVLGYSGYLGVALDTTSAAPLVAQVESGGAADDAGITAGSTITRIGGTSVTTSTQLRKALSATSAGDRVSITWRTSTGATHSTAVTLGQAPIS
jgi:S1-C subfamily serine protease